MTAKIVITNRVHAEVVDLLEPHGTIVVNRGEDPWAQEEVMLGGGGRTSTEPGLDGSTVGIVDFGAVGRAIARRPGGFEAHLLCHDPRALSEADSRAF